MDRLGGLPSTFEKINDEYKVGGRKYQVVTHPYYSRVGFVWRLVTGAIYQPGGAGNPIKLVYQLDKQELEFFGYGLKDNVDAFGLGARAATDADTNMQTKNRTNTEDVAIEGLSASCIGHRIEYPKTPPGFGDAPPAETVAMASGQVLVDDPGSNLIPPEFDSPLILEQGAYGKLAKVVSLNPVWNRKAEDHIGTLKDLPEGGGASYLRANGEPSQHNFWRLPEGWEWRREGTAEDTVFALLAAVQVPVTMIATLPQTFNPGNLGEEPAPVAPTKITTIVEIQMHTRSFYTPGKNA